MPASPILLLVPYRNKAAVLYSQIPTSASASGDMVVSRAGVSTRINAQGLIQSVAANVPRLNYPLGGVANGCPALLVEPSATNLVKYSDQFDTTTSGWTPNGLQTITGNTTATLDPAGGNTADIIVATSGSAEHNLSTAANNLGSVTIGTTLTWSVFAKATSAASGFIQFLFGGINFSPAGPYANFQLSGNGAVTTGTYSAASIQPFGNGWYRCSFTVIAAAAGTANFFIQPILTSGVARNDTFVGNGVDGVYLWGAQLETGSVATSYIPTTTGTVTRNADIVTNNTFVIPNLIGAILTEFDSPTSGTYFLDNIPIPIASGSNKIAISYTPTTLTIYRNGAQVSGSPVTPPGGTAPVIGNVINIGHNNQLYQLGSGIKSFVLYSSTLSAAEASGLTT